MLGLLHSRLASHLRGWFVPETVRLRRRIEDLEVELAEQRRLLGVWTFMEWIERASVEADLLISVIIPTRDRLSRLKRAIASVKRQTYANWELLIVDDASLDGTADFLAGLHHERIRTFRGEGRRGEAARNLALRHAKGRIIAYLDDDNLMHEQWLKSLAWGFTESPDTDVIYGAFVVDDPSRLRKKEKLPKLYFRDYDHHQLALKNIADQSCIAHRAGLPEAHFDETLREMGDWDLLLRLTKDKAPLPLPAIACYYLTDAPNRASYGETHFADKARVREKNRR
jgi:glycosyltransferase involved in cell wall biosynthesis